MPVHANSNLSSLLHSSLWSKEILDLYKGRSLWFNARRLRRLVFHTSKENDHLVLPNEEVYRYASRLLSMQEAFLLWFEKLPQSYKNLLVLLVKYPVLSVDRAYRMAGILDGNLSGSDFKSPQKSKILDDIKTKQKYILENIAVYKNGFVFCPAVFRRYIAAHLSALDEYKNLAEVSVCAEGDFSPVPADEILKTSSVFQKMDNIIEEKLKSAATIREAIGIIAGAPNSFDAAFLVPHLNLNARYWLSPKTTQEKIRQAESLCSFLESPFFENPVSFEKIENSFYDEIIGKIPVFYIPAEGNGYFVQLESEKAGKNGVSPLCSARTSACFGKRLELFGGDFLHSFVSVPAFNNLLLILYALGFFECTLEPGENPVHNARLYQLGKIRAVRRKG